MTKQLFIFIFLFIFSFSALAQQPERTVITLGYKSWFAKWKVDFGTGGVDQSDENSVTGPSINIRSGKVFFGANKFSGSFTFDYDVVFNGIHSKDSFSFDRDETDIFVGYDLSQNVSVVLGQKEIKIDQTDSNFAYKAKGNIFGITGRLRPLHSTQSIIFGSLSQSTINETSDTRFGDLKGPSVELGFAYVFENSKVSFTTSYKSQRYKVSTPGGAEADFDFSGLTTGLNYTIY